MIARIRLCPSSRTHARILWGVTGLPNGDIPSPGRAASGIIADLSQVLTGEMLDKAARRRS
jgi:hypothetical protein